MITKLGYNYQIERSRPELYQTTNDREVLSNGTKDDVTSLYFGWAKYMNFKSSSRYQNTSLMQGFDKEDIFDIKKKNRYSLGFFGEKKIS